MVKQIIQFILEKLPQNRKFDLESYVRVYFKKFGFTQDNYVYLEYIFNGLYFGDKFENQHKKVMEKIN